MKITKEDFDAWRDNPITQEFFKQIELQVETAREHWLNASWGNEALWVNGKARELRAICRARAEFAEDLLQIDFTEEKE